MAATSNLGTMSCMESLLSIIATIISSVALIGVAVGLILQGRQLKASQLQVMREMHLELLKIGIDNPALAGSLYEHIDLSEFSRFTLLNFLVTFWQTSYSLKTIPKKQLEFQAKELFLSERARNWWENIARKSYKLGDGAKLEREFFSVMDGAYQNVLLELQTADPTDGLPSSSKE